MLPRSLRLITFHLLGSLLYSESPAQAYVLTLRDLAVIKAVTKTYNDSRQKVEWPLVLNRWSYSRPSRGMLPGGSPRFVWGDPPAAAIQAADSLVANNQFEFALVLPPESTQFAVRDSGGFTISRPGYSHDYQTAMIVFGYNSGQYYLLVKRKQIWRVVRQCVAWDS